MLGRLQSLPLDAIQTHPKLQNRNIGMQKFKEYSDAKRYKHHVNDLARDIKTNGQQTPLTVVAAEEGGSYQLASGADQAHFVPTRYWLVDGHHRLEALKKIGSDAVQVEVVPGKGFADATDAARLANQQVVQSLSPLERTENAWTALNLERDTYRRMSVKTAAATLSVSENTIKRFRDAVRREGVQSGKIDPSAPRDKVEQQLQAYWSRKSSWGRFSIIAWHVFKRARREVPNPTSARAEKHRIKMEIAQLLFGEEGRHDLKLVVAALIDMGREAERPDGAAYLESKYKPKIYQPVTTDDDEAEGDHVDYHQLGLEVARMRAQEVESREPGDF